MKYTPNESSFLLYNDPQEHSDTILNFMNYVKTFDNSISYTLKNGILLFENDDQIIKINNVLYSDMSKRRRARQLLSCASFKQCTIYNHDNNKHSEGTINHVYCYSLPVNINNHTNKKLWKGLNEIFLEAIYENILYIAHINNNDVCYLTPIGKQYGIEDIQIVRAIQRACNIAANKGINMKVKLVHSDFMIENTYQEIPKNYPLVHVDVNSVWDLGFGV
jgi:hypothetical protein